MKVFIALLVAGLQLAAGLPQHDHGTATGDHDHGTPTTSVRPTTQPTSVKPSVTVPAPSPTGAAPTGCKVIAGDAGFPNAAAFSAALPGVVALPKTPDAPRPEYQYTVKTYADVQAAVKFAAKYNIRLSVLNSGHDFLGRYVVTLTKRKGDGGETRKAQHLMIWANLRIGMMPRLACQLILASLVVFACSRALLLPPRVPKLHCLLPTSSAHRLVSPRPLPLGPAFLLSS